jgi:hypothetical protein
MLVVNVDIGVLGGNFAQHVARRRIHHLTGAVGIALELRRSRWEW